MWIPILFSVLNSIPSLNPANMKQNVNFPTHIHGHTLHLVITSMDYHGVSNVKRDSYISDHFGVIFRLDCKNTPNTVPEKISFCRCHKINMPRFWEDLRTTDFVRAPAEDPTALYEQYINPLTRVMDIYAPIITKVLRCPTPEWITADYRNAKCLCRQYERLWRKNQNNPTMYKSRLRQTLNSKESQGRLLHWYHYE